MQMLCLEVNESDLDKLDLTNSGPPFYSFDANERTILLRQVPVYLTGIEIRNQVAKIESLQGHLEDISFSEPLKMHGFERFAWLTFDSEDAAALALSELDGITVRVPESFSAQQLEDYTLKPVKNN